MMSEQPGLAAGTAGPEVPTAINLPLHVNSMSRSMVLDAKSGIVAICVNNRRLGEYTDMAVAMEMARHIVASLSDWP